MLQTKVSVDNEGDSWQGAGMSITVKKIKEDQDYRRERDTFNTLFFLF